MAELMQPVVVKIGNAEALTVQNPDSQNVVLLVGNLGAKDAGHVSVNVTSNQIVVSVWDGAQVRGTFIDRETGKVVGIVGAP